MVAATEVGGVMGVLVVGGGLDAGVLGFAPVVMVTEGEDVSAEDALRLEDEGAVEVSPGL